MRSGLSQTIDFMLLLNHDASHPTRIIPVVLEYSSPADMSLVRLSIGIGSSFALLKENDMPYGWFPLFFAELKLRLIPRSGERLYKRPAAAVSRRDCRSNGWASVR